MSCQEGHLLSGGHLPKADRFVRARGGQRLAVDRKRDGMSLAGVPRKAAEFFAGAKLPETDGVITTRRGERPAVRRSRERLNRTVVPETHRSQAGECTR